MSRIEIILEDLKNHPYCPHGPTILFSRTSNGKNQKFFACAACRDRKECSFYLCEDERDKVNHLKRKRLEQDRENFIKGVNHRRAFINFNKIKQLSQPLRQYCCSCDEFVLKALNDKHENHQIVNNVKDYMLLHPSEFLVPLDNPKKEAQFLFSKLSVETVVNIIQEQGFRNVLCVGAPRIFEYILENSPKINTLLLDIDRRYHSFFGPLQFCWYNMFNHYFFLSDAEQVFKDFLQNDRGEGLVLITDPPFGGRVELLAQTIGTINKLYKKINNFRTDLPILFIFPYFMEPQILNSLPEFCMLDYKVDYDNHPLFQDGSKGRKLGSPVRIFTNINASSIKLPADQGYKHCNYCNRWVSVENKHCNKCNACTSKDGRTYVHCDLCKRCVKPSWIHCATCKRCAQSDHTCQELPFVQTCFHCKEFGHKKRACPKINHKELQQKRKKGMEIKSKKLKTVRIT